MAKSPGGEGQGPEPDAGAMMREFLRRRQTQESGVTGVSIWAESHAAIHTWDEDNYYAFDAFSCRDFHPKDALRLLLTHLRYRDAQLCEPLPLPALCAPGVRLPGQRRLGGARPLQYRRRARGRELRSAWAESDPRVHVDLLDGCSAVRGSTATKMAPPSTVRFLVCHFVMTFWDDLGQLHSSPLRLHAAAGAFFPSPADWRDEVLYFLLPDRFSDGGEAGRPAAGPGNLPRRGRPSSGSTAGPEWAASAGRAGRSGASPRRSIT